MIHLCDELKVLLQRLGEAKGEERLQLQGQVEQEQARIREQFGEGGAGLGKYNRAFCARFGGKVAGALGRAEVEALLAEVKTIKVNAGEGNLADFHLYFEEYSRPVLAMPGQRDPRERPVMVTGFGSDILIMDSIRKPKRLKFYGSDEK
jgi:hypothetical protein